MNVERLAEILREAARAEIMPRFRRLDEGMVKAKTGPFDLVTQADEAAERAIGAAIARAWPHALVIGEEAVAANPALLERRAGAETVVYVDPVDGTANFAGGLPLFAVMAAVVARGEVVAGVIYDPLGDDWVMAERGCGAWQKFPDGRMERLRFAEAVPVDEMGGLASPGFFEPALRRRLFTNLAGVRQVASYRCAGHEYRLAAGGHVHFLLFGKLMPWDHLAGALIVAEAGACVARLDGSAYRADHREGGLLIAPDAESWRALHAALLAD